MNRDTGSYFPLSTYDKLLLHDPAYLHGNDKSPDWIGLRSVLRPRQHSIGYMGDGFYRSKDPTNSIKVLKKIYKRERKQRVDTHILMKASVNVKMAKFQFEGLLSGKVR